MIIGDFGFSARSRSRLARTALSSMIRPLMEMLLEASIFTTIGPFFNERGSDNKKYQQDKNNIQHWRDVDLCFVFNAMSASHKYTLVLNKGAGYFFPKSMDKLLKTYPAPLLYFYRTGHFTRL
jgi:hypothetical protein